MEQRKRILLGIDPGLANTGWGIVLQEGGRLTCVAYGCITTTKEYALAYRLRKIYEQMCAVVEKYQPTCVGIETVWFGSNAQTAFATGQARGAALAACAKDGMEFGEYSPLQIKKAVVGIGSAEKEQVQYMVARILKLKKIPSPDHSADALAAAITFTTHNPLALNKINAIYDKRG